MDDPTLEPDERRAVLRRYGQKYKLSEFVETGTSEGATCLYLRDNFEHLYTIELSEVLHRKALDKFKPHPHIEAFLGDSTEVLPQVLEKLSGPALFWLDGHHSGGDTARGDKDTPVIEELDAILHHGVRPVILIDDARLFGGMSHYGEHDWPHIDEVKNAAKRHSYKCRIQDDIVRLTPM